jgi:uncharacterized alkaline shock family protein YloU
MRSVRVVAHLVALAVTGGLGVTFIIGGAGGISFSSVWEFLGDAPGTILLIVVGVLLLAVAVRFLLAIADERLAAALFSRQGDFGRIELTPYAVREFISGVLRQELGIDRFRVQLDHRGGGVAITVRTTLSPDQRVTEVGERIQRELARHVPERTGVDVHEVSVVVRSIRGKEGPAGDVADEAGAER